MLNITKRTSVNGFGQFCAVLVSESLSRHLMQQRIVFVMQNSVARWLDYVFIFGHFQNETLPKSIKNWSKSVQNFAKYYISPQKNTKEFCQVVILHQIWSHCG